MILCLASQQCCNRRKGFVVLEFLLTYEKPCVPNVSVLLCLWYSTSIVPSSDSMLTLMEFCFALCFSSDFRTLVLKSHLGLSPKERLPSLSDFSVSDYSFTYRSCLLSLLITISLEGFWQNVLLLEFKETKIKIYLFAIGEN